MPGKRIAGRISVKVNGVLHSATGAFTYNLGRWKREFLAGPSSVDGFKETKLIPFIEGEIRDNADLDLAALVDATDATVTLELANGKTIMLREAAYTADGDGETDEAKIQFRFEGASCEEV